MLKEKDILHENKVFWVMRDKHGNCETYTIMENVGTHSVSRDFCTYPDLSIAIARCDYLAKRV
jgi:hypothetical protein